MNRTVIALIVWLVSGSTALAQERGARIFRLEELTAPQIDALDRAKTAFILPVGMIEVHGPHLPVGADSLGVIYEAHAASRQVSTALPDWNIVMMPPINYGQSGANEIGGRLVHPGTYAIRQTTLRSLVADLGAQLAQNGFKWIFVLNGHGAPTHNLAINEACDFVSETFRVTMLHVTGLLRADTAIQLAGQKINAEFFSANDLSSFGMDVHAGVGETSGMLAIRPDLVSADYKSLPRRVGRSVTELREIAAAPDWQGYVSDPARASAAHGRAIEAWWIGGFADLMVRAIRGENMFVHPRFPDAVPAEMNAVVEKTRANEAAFGASLEKWLSEQPR